MKHLIREVLKCNKNIGDEKAVLAHWGYSARENTILNIRHT